MRDGYVILQRQQILKSGKSFMAPNIYDKQQTFTIAHIVK